MSGTTTASDDPSEVDERALGGLACRGALTLELATIAAHAAASKTMEPTTVVLDVGELIGITDYFVITSGRNDRQVKAIVDEVSKQVREAGGGRCATSRVWSAATWVLLDFGDFIVHVFSREAREFYDLERLWRDARSTKSSSRARLLGARGPYRASAGRAGALGVDRWWVDGGRRCTPCSWRADRAVVGAGDEALTGRSPLGGTTLGTALPLKSNWTLEMPGRFVMV